MKQNKKKTFYELHCQQKILCPIVSLKLFRFDLKMNNVHKSKYGSYCPKR